MYNKTKQLEIMFAVQVHNYSNNIKLYNNSADEPMVI